MMTNEIKYRLGDFIINEHREVLLTWVTHVALGAQRSGRCFILGNILLIGSLDREEAGFLKLEYHEQLMKLPPWNKTRYYCFASSLRTVGTEQSLEGYLRKHLAIEKIGTESANITAPGTFRLDRFKINVGESGDISWQTVGELNRTISGKCFAESGILFIGPKENELDEERSRKKIFNELKLLPQWDRTFAWGFYRSLRICEESRPKKSHKAVWKPEYMKTLLNNNRPFRPRREFREEKSSKPEVPLIDSLKTAWQRIVGRKIWGRLVNLMVLGVIYGFRMFIFTIEKMVFLFRKIIKRSRRHPSK